MQNSTLQITNISQFTSLNVIFNGQGTQKELSAGVISSLDHKVLNDCFITGARFKVRNAIFADTASFQVIDIDGIVSPAGTVLNQFITEWSMIEDRQTQIDFSSPYPAKILSGLYLRIVYKSYGSIPVFASADYYLHDALI